jgi:DNA-binding Xre family transcriptional regulator
VLLHIGSRYRITKSSAGKQSFYSYTGGIPMAVSYKKLWKLLIDKDIKKKDLSSMAGISPATITKMGKNGHVTTEVLVKICSALECKVEDIMEIVDVSPKA